MPRGWGRRVTYAGYYAWTSEMLYKSSLCYHDEQLPQRNRVYYKYIMENGRVVEAHAVSEFRSECMSWPDTKCHGRIVGDLGAFWPHQSESTILAIAYGIWQETGLTFTIDPFFESSINSYDPKPIPIDEMSAVKFEGSSFLCLKDNTLSFIYSGVERQKRRANGDQESLELDLAEDGSLERVIDEIRRQCKK